MKVMPAASRTLVNVTVAGSGRISANSRIMGLRIGMAAASRADFKSRRRDQPIFLLNNAFLFSLLLCHNINSPTEFSNQSPVIKEASSNEDFRGRDLRAAET